MSKSKVVSISEKTESLIGELITEWPEMTEKHFGHLVKRDVDTGELLRAPLTDAPTAAVEYEVTTLPNGDVIHKSIGRKLSK